MRQRIVQCIDAAGGITYRPEYFFGIGPIEIGWWGEYGDEYHTISFPSQADAEDFLARRRRAPPYDKANETVVAVYPK
jgi:hypothetical protein